MPDSELTAFTLRLSADLLAAVDHRAAQAGMSRQRYIESLLRAETEPGSIILGRWRVQGSEAETCADCGQPLDPAEIWIGATADGRLFGPLCEMCSRGN